MADQWAGPRRGRVRIPIERAMELVAQGLPVARGDAKRRY